MLSIAGSSSLVDEVELDLQAGRRVVGVEPRLDQHALEHVEAGAHLRAVARAVLAGERLLRDVLAHGPYRRGLWCPRGMPDRVRT